MVSFQRKEKGFSFIELAVVLAIAIVLAAIAIGSYSNFREGRRLRSAGQAVNSIFVTARSYAITNGKPHRVVFEMRDPVTMREQISFWIDEYDISTAMDTAPFPASPVPVSRAKLTTPEFLAEGVRIQDISVDNLTTSDTMAYPFPFNYAVVRFFPDGTSDMATVHMLEETGNPALSRDYYTIRLYGSTAKPRVYAYERR